MYLCGIDQRGMLIASIIITKIQREGHVFNEVRFSSLFLGYPTTLFLFSFGDEPCPSTPHPQQSREEQNQY